MSDQDVQELYVLTSWNSFKPKPALLLQLAPVLPEQMLSQAIGLALLIEDEPMRTKIVTALVDRIPEASREAVLEQVLTEARAIEQTDLQARALLGLIPFLSAPLLQQALEAAWAIKDKERRVEVLAAIIPSLPKSSRSKVLRQTLKAVQTIEAEGNRARALAMLAPSLSSIEQPNLFIQALAVVRSFRDSGRRVSILARLIQYLPPSLQTEVQQEWENLLKEGAAPPGFPGDEVIFGIPAIVGERLRALMLQIPEDERNALLEEVFQSIREEFLPAKLYAAAVEIPPLSAFAEEEPAVTGEVHASGIYVPGLHIQHQEEETVVGASAESLTSAVPPTAAEPNVPGPHPVEAIPPPTPPLPGPHPVEAAPPPTPVPPPTTPSPQPQPQAAPPPTSPQQQKVSVGFANEANPGIPLDQGTPLACSQAYYFWLEIGEPVQGAITEASASPLPALPAEAQLKVVLFPVKGVTISPGAAVGELQLKPDGTFQVMSQPPGSLNLLPDSPLRQSRLFFPLQTPANAGIISFFCNIYYEQVLLQQRFIQARVMLNPQPTDWGFSSSVDYTIDSTLSPNYLQSIATHRLSLMPVATDSAFNFCFFGMQDDEIFNHNVQVDADKLQALIDQARGALSQAAWGTTVNWVSTDQYRYADGARDLGRLEADLKEFALRGFQIYDAISSSGALAGVSNPLQPKALSLALENLMREPGLVQIALTQSPRFVPPVALFYDYNLNTEAPNYTFCPAFEQAFNDNTPLENLPCFQGNCPTKDNDTVICPSGFWGYRHCLGMPVSVGNSFYIVPQLTYQEPLQWTTCVWTGPDFTMRVEHLQKMRALQPNINWLEADTRADTMKLLMENTSPLIYFYCHGGADETGQPFLQVGLPTDFIIVASSLHNIAWENLPHPLVFINGCHTAALQPEQAVEFVSAFIDCGAVGVIGTDITIFEPLACAFAEECFRRFLGNMEIGEAVRGARLALLQSGNPLGLVYIPFVLPSLRLIKQ